MNTTEQLSTYFVDTAYDDIPNEVAQLSKRYVKDWLAAAIGGYGTEAGKIIIKCVQENGGNPEARILGSGLKTSLANAALVNGTLGHLLDFDDFAPSHPTASVLPTALALGEKLHSSGKELILAQIMGYECFNRLYQAAREYELVLRRKGVHPTTLWGTCAAAVVAAKMLGFDVEKTRMTLGLAATQATGLMENFGTPTKGFHCGNSARAGISSALMVRQGYKASKTILEGSHGFYNALIGKGNYDLSRITHKIGEEWLLLNPGIDTKKYPSCGATLRAIEASICLAKENDITAGQIESIEVSINMTRKNFLRFDKPTCGDEAKFSMPYAVAVALADRNVTLDSYSDEKVNQPIMQELVGKVKLTVMDDSLDDDIKKTTPVTVTLKNGKVYSKNIIDFTGSAPNPMSEEDLREKFLYCASIPNPALSSEKVDNCLGVIDSLETCGDVNAIIDELVV
jgi:2-methylcitrate dehydratase PrpD